MTKLPKTIIAVVIKHSNKYSHLRKICREFFEGLPHIVYTDCNLDSNNIYYIFTAENLVETIIRTNYGDLDISVILGCDIYEYTEDCSSVLHTYMPNNYTWAINEQDFPDCIRIDPNDVKKLESL